MHYFSFSLATLNCGCGSACDRPSATEVDHGTVTALIAMSLTEDAPPEEGHAEKTGYGGGVGGAKAKELLKSSIMNVNWMSHLDDINSAIPPPVMMRDIAPPPVDISVRCCIKTVLVVKESVGGATEALPPPPPQEGNTQTVPIPAVASSKESEEEGVGEVVDRYDKMHLTVESGAGGSASGETTIANVTFSNDVLESSWAVSTSRSTE